MKLDELKIELHRLMNKYVNDNLKKEELKKMIDVDGTPGVRGIFTEINRAGAKFEKKDSDIVKDIFFYFG